MPLAFPLHAFTSMKLTCVLDIPTSAAVNPHIAVAVHSALALMLAWLSCKHSPLQLTCTPPHVTPKLAAAPCPCLL